MNYVEQLNSSYLKPYLFSYRRCPYAMRARMALVESNIEFDIYEISLRSKPREMLLISPKGTVPVLRLGKLVLDESLEIMKWAYENSNNHSLSMMPKDTLIVDELISLNDGQFKESLDCYKYYERFPEKSKLEHREHCCLFIDILEQRLEKMPFLMGDKRTIVDISIFPFIRQFVGIDQDWFGKSKYTRVRKWLATLIDSELYKKIMEKPTFG